VCLAFCISDQNSSPEADGRHCHSLYHALLALALALALTLFTATSGGAAAAKCSRTHRGVCVCVWGGGRAAGQRKRAVLEYVSGRHRVNAWSNMPSWSHTGAAGGGGG
jgi:hypothetical protein